MLNAFIGAVSAIWFIAATALAAPPPACNQGRSLSIYKVEGVWAFVKKSEATRHNLKLKTGTKARICGSSSYSGKKIMLSLGTAVLEASNDQDYLFRMNKPAMEVGSQLYLVVKAPKSAAQSPKPAVVSPIPVQELMVIATQPEKLRSVKVDELLGRLAALEKGSPLWSFGIFLTAEIIHQKGEAGKAAALYSKLLEWAASDPYKDGSGGSGLAVVGLWRLLRHQLKQGGTTAEYKKTLALAQRVLAGHLPMMMLKRSNVYSLPALRPELWLHMFMLAKSADETASAKNYAIEYLQTMTAPVMPPAVQQFIDEQKGSDDLWHGKAMLIWAHRLYRSKKYNQCHSLLASLTSHHTPAVRGGALLLYGRLLLRQGKPTQAATAYLEAQQAFTDPNDRAVAAYKHAFLIAKQRTGYDMAKLKQAVLDLSKTYPTSPESADALLTLGRMQKSRGMTSDALSTFAVLRQLNHGDHDRQDSSHFIPALILYQQGGADNLRQARELLRALYDKRPWGPFWRRTLFWLGRISLELGETDKAERWFRIAIDKKPYDFVAIRSRMYLRKGLAARGLLAPGPETMAELTGAFQKSTIHAATADKGAHQAVVGQAVARGLYGHAVKVDVALRRSYPNQSIQMIKLADLDATGLMSGAVVLMALRQEVLLAANTSYSVANRLGISRLAASAGDWQIAMWLVHGLGMSQQVRASISKSRAFLPLAYPGRFISQIERAAAKHQVRPEALYAIVRRESSFYPAAVSPDGAMGLFQFMPTTFNAFDRKHRIMVNYGKQSAVELIMDTGTCLELGALWLAKELLASHGDNLLYALLEHNAGGSRARRWKRHWEQQGRLGDVDYEITTIPYAETRLFVQGVFADVVLSKAAGWFNQASKDHTQHRDGRFIKGAEGVITDRRTGLQWFLGPDRRTNWYWSRAWVKGLSVDGGGWRMPTRSELMGISRKNARNTGPIYLPDIFTTSGRWVWSGEIRQSPTAWLFDFGRGVEHWYPRNLDDGLRVFAVR